MTERGFGVAKDYHGVAAEHSTFPVLCETCLGDNPLIRMVRMSNDKQCKICAKVYTGYRWQPGRKARFKNTIVCQGCAKKKNVCQTCLFDMEFNLPVQVRDRYLAMAEAHATPDDLEEAQRALAEEIEAKKPKTEEPVQLARARQTGPAYRRNEQKTCSFWVQGCCTRGELCPYLHADSRYEKSGMCDKEIRDRYHGKDKKEGGN
eukprot:GHVH01004483.1.p1 GENE.GHVH01004483.1~~GHVH01004483.1.p1  ORF type:complete len:220 (+),score=22.21 GHVH01004483.1:48-662(+)